MFQLSGFPLYVYEFDAERRRITGVGFPHSEIRGSMAVQRLTAAYRSRPRPSSAPDAKASTVCPSYLDGEPIDACMRADGVYTHSSMLAIVQFSSSAEDGRRGTPATRSLETEQRAGES